MTVPRLYISGCYLTLGRMEGTVVLVVDDEPQIRRVVRHALGGDARVIEAATGRDAIDQAAAERPSLIVLDLGLPDISGIEVCKEIRAGRPPRSSFSRRVIRIRRRSRCSTQAPTTT